MILPAWAVRGAIVAGALAAWFATQRLLGRRAPAGEGRGPPGDPVHRWTARWNAALHARPAAADRLLVASSLGVDLLGAGILASSLLGPSFGPFLGLILIFTLRQVCQVLVPLPPPPGMIWRDPGFPTALVTYGTANDLFFSGHTAIVVYGAALLSASFGTAGLVAGCALALFEIAAVLVLRAHWTVDVLAGAAAGILAHHAVGAWAPAVDRWIAAL